MFADDDEEDVVAVYVKMTVTYKVDDIPHLAVHHFVDFAPDLETSRGLIGYYQELEDVYFDIHHGDLPDPTPEPNHYGSASSQ